MKKKVDIRRKKIARQAEKNQQSVVQNSLIASELAVKEESIPRIDELEGLETIAVLPGKIKFEKYLSRGKCLLKPGSKFIITGEGIFIEKAISLLENLKRISKAEGNGLIDSVIQLKSNGKPLLNRLQVALSKQQEAELSRVDLELIENLDKFKKLDKEKEDIGVGLYGNQQQLADLQGKFEKAHQVYNEEQDRRIQSEAQLKECSDRLQLKKAEVEELKKKSNKAFEELSKLNVVLKNLDEVNLEDKNQIKVTRRITYRLEEDIVNAEKKKQSQDVLIDVLNEEIKKLNEQKLILEAQIQAQKDETENAKKILKDAEAEMEKIIASKKNLLEHWQKSLYEISERDKNLKIVRDALKIQSVMNIKVSTEMMGVEKEIRKENEQSTLQAALLDKLKREEIIQDNLAEKLKGKREKIASKLRIMDESLRSTDQEIKKLDNEQKSLEDQMTAIENNIMKLHTETKKKMEEIRDKVSQHKTMEKTAANMIKMSQGVDVEIQGKKIEKANIKNEISRVQLDILNTEGQLMQLDSKLKEKVNEKDEKQALVSTYEIKIQSNHDMHEKKMHDIAKYNKELEEINQRSGEVSNVPIEAKRNHYLKEIDRLTVEIDQMNGQFIKKQKKFVSDEIKMTKKSEKLSLLRTKEVILQQKKMRLEKAYQGHNKEIAQIQSMLKNFQSHSEKMNKQLSKYYAASKKLQAENINVHSDFKERLKELKKESIGLEIQIDRLKENKAELLAEIVEQERQVLFWQRKRQLEEEMQKQMDPTVGQTEIGELKKEIHMLEIDIEKIRKVNESFAL